MTVEYREGVRAGPRGCDPLASMAGRIGFGIGVEMGIAVLRSTDAVAAEAGASRAEAGGAVAGGAEGGGEQGGGR